MNWPDFPQLWSLLSLNEERWRYTYPGLEIQREVLRMGEWLEANPTKQPKKNWKRFMVAWLARNQAALERVEVRQLVEREQLRLASQRKYISLDAVLEQMQLRKPRREEQSR